MLAAFATIWPCSWHTDTPQLMNTSFFPVGMAFATGFETVDQARFPAYKSAVEGELAKLGPPPASYVAGDDPRFERIASFEAVCNRVLVYRGFSLHSAEIDPGAGLDADPRIGRLTANAFFWTG